MYVTSQERGEQERDLGHQGLELGLEEAGELRPQLRRLLAALRLLEVDLR